MTFSAWMLFVALVVAVCCQAVWAYQLHRLQQSGMRVWALRCYRDIHGGGLRQAKEAVERLAEEEEQ